MHTTELYLAQSPGFFRCLNLTEMVGPWGDPFINIHLCSVLELTILSKRITYYPPPQYTSFAYFELDILRNCRQSSSEKLSFYKMNFYLERKPVLLKVSVSERGLLDNFGICPFVFGGDGNQTHITFLSA